MKLRWKYFIILLAVSLVPMTVVTLISQNAARRLGQSISDQTQQALLDVVQREVVSATENYAMITGWAKTSLEMALQVLVKEAEMALSLPRPDMPRVYFASDFDSPQTAPDDLAASRDHLQVLDDGRLIPKLVSYKHANFILAPGVNRADVEDQIARFTRLSSLLNQLNAQLSGGIFWVYASLKSGVHISYPGHGGYPADYDPRKRPWYLRARKAGEFTWGEPIVDATTGQLTLTVSAPFFNADGSFAGVAAIDALIPNVLLESQISSQWSQQMKSFLVGRSVDVESGEVELWVLSQKKMVFKESERQITKETGAFFKEEEKTFSWIVQNFENQPSGSIELAFQGQDSVLAYATVFPGLYFVIVAPKSIITGLPEAVGERFAQYTEGRTIITISAILIIIVIVAAMAFFVSRLTTRKVMGIVNGFKQLEQGDFSYRLTINFKDERDLIVTAFNQIMPRLKDYLRMSRGLVVAKEVQQSLLPKANPALEGFDIAGTSLYCEETGGDYYDFIPVRGNRLAVVVGDVSGHGVSAALLMASARALIMSRAALPGSAAGIISDVNRHLSLDTYDTGNFMTFFYCGLKATSHRIHWVRAGHEPALLYDPQTDEFDELKGDGMAFGLDYEFEYHEYQRMLAPDQILLIGTDGIWEMFNEAGEMFGKQRLMETIRANHAGSAGQILDAIMVALDRFRGARPPDDDVTMVVIKVNPDAGG